ncbi:MAG: glycosyltransferase family 39 protein [Candidatus Eremiobacteraeota bacterium]|nr:glycosyltransferase family 39 protein [Candidatus Eremiobacteraeota bacterium]
MQLLLTLAVLGSCNAGNPDSFPVCEPAGTGNIGQVGELKKLPSIAALLVFIAHLVANPHYGFYRDELYFIICGFRPDWGYVDQPPLVPLLSAASQIFGPSLVLLRALPALFAAAGVYATCLFVIELGGGTFAQVIAAAITALTPVLAAFGTKVSTDMPGLFLWPMCALLVARIANGASARLWVAVGLALGIAAEAKYTAFLFAAALLAGIALTPLRRILATPWLLAGVAAGTLVALPSLVWQSAHGFPILQMLANQQREVVASHTPIGALLQQILVTNPLMAPIWIVGLVYAFQTSQLRWIGWTYVLVLAVMIGFDARNYYAGDVYPLAIATGALAVERVLRTQTARSAVTGYVAAAALLTIPFVLPILPEDRLAKVVAATKRVVHLRVSPERHPDAALTDNFAGMHGWPRLTATVAEVYRSLPLGDRSRTAILTSNFAEAAALDFYGRAYSLPPAISGNNNYWIWGPRGYDGSIVVEVNGTCGPMFTHARVAVARFHDAWATLSEENTPISICYGLREPLAAYWPHLKRYI